MKRIEGGIGMKSYIFTFGIGMKHERTAVRIKASNSTLAREKMAKEFGLKWAFQYEEDDYYRMCKELGIEPYPIKFEFEVTE